MSAAGLIEQLRGRGITLQAKGDRLRFRPAEAVSPEMLATIRAHKAELLEELTREGAREGALNTPVNTPVDTPIEGAQIAEIREELGAVLLRTAYFDRHVWLALSPNMAAELRAEEAERTEPRPVLEAQDVVALRGRSTAAIRAFLEVVAVFPGTRVLQ